MKQSKEQITDPDLHNKSKRTSDNFTSPMLNKKVSKNRMPLGGFFTPGNLKSHHYMNKQRNSGMGRDHER